MQSIPLHTSSLFSKYLNEDIWDIQKPYEICLITCVVDEFSGLFLFPLVFYIMYWGYA